MIEVLRTDRRTSSGNLEAWHSRAQLPAIGKSGCEFAEAALGLLCLTTLTQKPTAAPRDELWH